MHDSCTCFPSAIYMAVAIGYQITVNYSPLVHVCERHLHAIILKSCYSKGPLEILWVHRFYISQESSAKQFFLKFSAKKYYMRHMNQQEANTNVGLLSKHLTIIITTQADGNSFSICSMCHCHNLPAHILSAKFIHLLLHNSFIL